MTRLLEEQGEVAVARLGSRRLVVVRDLESVNRVLVANARNYARARAVVSRRQRPVPQPGSIGPTELDLSTRRMLQPAFARAHVDELWPELLAAAQARVREWSAGDEVEVLEPIRAAVVGLSVRALFREDLDLPLPQLASAARICAGVFEPATSPLSDLVDAFRLPSARRIYRSERALRGTLQRLLESRTSTAGDDVLSILARAGSARGWSAEGLLDKAFTLVLTFADSTAPVTAWLLYELAKDPSLQAKVRSEVEGLRRSPPGRTSAGWLEAAQHEALRLYPSSWRIGRVACGADRLGDVAVEAGDYIWISPFLLHRSPVLWTDPNTFRPERWLDGSAARVPRLGFLPFGAGARMCLGDHVAWQVMAAVTAAELSRFAVALPAGVREISFDPRWPVRRPRDGGIALRLSPSTAQGGGSLNGAHHQGDEICQPHQAGRRDLVLDAPPVGPGAPQHPARRSR